MSNYELLNLYEHNIESYEKIVSSFKENNIVGIVHATGTGKSYNALQLALDNKDKKILYITPSNGIIEHIKKIIEDNKYLDLEKDFPNLEFRTYQSLINLSYEQLLSISCDLLILDEFHHLGAPVWGNRINTLIETHNNIQVFGMTAYTIRDRNTSYERDMANPLTNELFSNKIVSKYDLCDAMIDGLLPKPIYKTAYTSLLDMEESILKKANKLSSDSNEYKEYMVILKNIKRRINDALSMPDILKKTLKPNGKYIYFCPPFSEEGTNDIETIKKQTLEYLKEFINEDNIEIYTSTSEMGLQGKKNREAFYNDLDLNGQSVKNKLRIMFAINQYNEGIHAPNVDGVIMGRGTTSDIVYFEQLGRALSVRGNTLEMYNKYSLYSKEELINLCIEKDIHIKENITKEKLIENLIAPVVIDLTNNYSYIEELENNLKDRVREIQENKSTKTKRKIKLLDVSFDIEIENKDIYEMLKRLNERLSITWESMYEYAKEYYEHYGNLEVPGKFKTNDGYTYSENGKINLGLWIHNQRKNTSLDSERGKKLSQIGMRFETRDNNRRWESMYEYAKKYYEHHGNLNVVYNFKTDDGYTYSEDGKINLGGWVNKQRQKTKIDSEKGQKLLQIGMSYNNLYDLQWENMYEYAKKYYEHHGNLNVVYNFKTDDGYTYSEDGKINLGVWISNQRQRKNTEMDDSERVQKLLQIGMSYNNLYDLQWENMYEYAKKYYEYYGNLEVPQKFKTNDGYTYNEDGKISLGAWINTQRQNVKIDSKRGKKLLEIGMRFNTLKTSWESMYEYAKKYYEHYGNLEIPYNFKTNDGYTYSRDGKINLGLWLVAQKRRTSIDSERGKKLLEIGMRFEKKDNDFQWKNMYEYAKKYYEHYGNLEVPQKFKTNDGHTYNEDGKINLGTWISNQRVKLNEDSKEGRLLIKIGMVRSARTNKNSIQELCNFNNINYNLNKDILSHISIQEFISKIEYLKINNISVIDNSGKLHQIFNMNSTIIEKEYGISLEELITTYYLDKKRSI